MRKQRNICRVAFVLCGVLPLLATLAYAGWRTHRFDAGHFADHLGLSLGCEANVQDAIYARPGVLRLVGVDLSNSETHQPLLYCDTIDVQQSNGVLDLRVHTVEVADAAADQVLFRIHERLLCQPKLLAQEVSISIELLRFDHADETAFVDSTIDLRQIDQGTELRAALYPLRITGQSGGGQTDSEQTKATPVDFTIIRKLDGATYTKVMLETWQHELPASLLFGERNWLPQFASLTSFRGNVWVDFGPDGWSGAILGGRLRNVDLQEFLGTSFGGWIKGTANVDVFTTEFTNGRLRTLDVDVYSSMGTIRKQQLEAATTTWQLGWNEQPTLQTDVVDYQQLACKVYLASGQLELRGLSEPAGTLLTLSTSHRLTTAPHNAVHADRASILSVLFPLQPEQEPVSAEAEHLLRILPPPSARGVR